MDVVLWVVAAALAAVALVCALAATVAPALERGARIGVEVAQGLMFLVVGADLLAWAAGGSPSEPTVHVGYCVAAVALIPLVTVRPRGDDEADPEPASLWVLAIAVAAVAVVTWRMAATR